ncbi:MAG: hypothetical protein ACT4O1_12835 [Gemmatimonadota bacterium]
MRPLVRVISGLNAVYQTIVAVLCLTAPAVTIALYGAPEGAAELGFLRGTIRILGAALLLGAAISALIARDPDRHPVLLPLIALLGATTLTAEALMLAAGEAVVSQLALDIGVQVVITGTVLAYYSRSREVEEEAILRGARAHALR